MTSTPTPEPAKITCPDCGGHPSEPKLRTEGGSLSCSFCNRTLTFNFMRDNEPEHRACACRASRNARCQTCGGDGEIDVRPAPSTPGEGTGRPGGWVEGIGWVALFHDLPEGTRFLSHSASEPPITSIVGVMCSPDDWENYPVIVTRWADGTTPAPPASPADDVPDADAVAFQNGYRIGVRVGSEHHGPCRGLPPASPVPPTPTPCPYIVTGGEGTSYCSLAEQTPTPQADGGWLRRLLSMPTLCRLGQLDAELREATSERQEEEIAAAFPEAVHDLLNALDALAAAPPSTPADPHPTDPTGSEA